MKDILTPVFGAGALSLMVFHHLDLYHGIFFSFIVLGFGLTLIFYVLGWYRWSYVCIVLSLVLLLTLVFLKEKHDFKILSQQLIPQNQYISIEGMLLDYPEVKKDHSSIILKTRILEYNRKRIPREFNIRIRVKGELLHLSRGDAIAIQAKVFPNHFNQNFYPSPFKNYVLYNNLHFKGYCKSDQLVRLVEKSNWVWRTIGTWRSSVRQVIEKKLMNKNGDLDRKGVFLEAILIGERGRMTESQKDSLLSSGIFHLFAISGAHIGIIAVLSLVFLKLLGISLRNRIIITLMVLILFLALSGFKISALRAVIMAIFILTARLFHFNIHIFSIVSLSGLFILFTNPVEILDPGFILTYILTMAIIIGREIFIPFLKHIPRYVRELISANFTASLVSLPLSLYFFKRYSFAGFFAGLVLLPLTTVIIGFGMVMLMVAPFSTTLATGILQINLIPLNLFFAVVDLFSQTINLTIFSASPSFFWLCLILFLFYSLRFQKKFRFQKVLLFIFFLGSLIVISVPQPIYNPAHLEVYFLDVGQGDSQLVVFPGGESLLIDGGGSYYSDFKVGRHLVLPFILEKRIKIKWIAVSHFHPDHCRGIVEIINIVNPDELWISTESKRDVCFKSLMESLNKSINVKRLAAPFIKTIAGCEIKFLSPDKFSITDFTHNNHSQVIKISDGFHSFLFTGDIEMPVESFLVRARCDELKSTVLKIPHHGSKTSSTSDFLGCVDPEVAVFSFAKNNRFHFPHQSVLKKLKIHRIRWLSTATRGGIKIISIPQGLQIEVSK